MRGGALTVVVAALVSAACDGGGPPGGAVAAPPAPPNVVLIVVDTLRGDRCGFAGYERPNTPRLSEFARDAVVFRNAWAPSCWTPPAHATLFTGLRPERHGTMAGNRIHLLGVFDTIAEVLKERGYATAAYVNNPVLESQPSFFQGFDVVEYPFQAAQLDPSNERSAHVTVGKMLDTVRADVAAGKPFFVFANLLEPHLSYRPDPARAAPFVEAWSPEQVAAGRAVEFADAFRHSCGGARLPPEVIQTLSDLYDAEVEGVDRDIGTLLDGLRELGVLDDTLFVVTSDHGEGFDEHGRLEHLHNLYAETLHIPLLVRYPGRFDGGRVHDELVRLEDVTATIFDVCGTEVPNPFDGVSLAGDLSGRVARAAIGDNARMVWFVSQLVPDGPSPPTFPATRSVRSGRHHLIVNREGTTHLFDVESDPAEAHDLAATLPDVVEELRALVVW